MRTMNTVVLLLAFLPATVLGQSDDKSVTELNLEDAIKSIPIQRVPTTPEQREQQRKLGHPVMLVKGRPGYLYRDYLQAQVADTWLRPATPAMRMPQDNPDVYGCVTVSFEIRPDGKTDAFEVMKSEPPGMFDEHALRAVFATEYEPNRERTAQAREKEAGEVAGGAERGTGKGVKGTDQGGEQTAPAADAPTRYERSIWFLVARPPRAEFSRVNKVVEDARNRRREELREACEGTGA